MNQPNLFDPKITRKKSTFELATEFIENNPEVMGHYVRFCRALVSAGREHYGINALTERVRWHVNVDTHTEDEFKVNNNYAPHIARWLAKSYPEFAGMFRFRALAEERKKKK